MRIATFNIRHGRAYKESGTDNERMVRTVAALGADIVALQEVDVRAERSGVVHQAESAAVASGMVHHFGSVVDFGSGGHYGNALLVRGEISSVTDLLFPSSGEQRGAILATVSVDGVEINVAATHLQVSRSGRPHEAPRQLEQMLETLDGVDGPCVVMGDLNMAADEVVPRFAAAGFTPAESGPTYPAGRPTRRIDWIGLRGSRARGRGGSRGVGQ